MQSTELKGKEKVCRSTLGMKVCIVHAPLQKLQQIYMLSFTQSTCLHTLKDGRQIHRNCWHFFNLHLSANKSRKKTLNKNLYVNMRYQPLCLFLGSVFPRIETRLLPKIFFNVVLIQTPNVGFEQTYKSPFILVVVEQSTMGQKMGNNANRHNLKMAQWPGQECKIDILI